MSGFRRSPAPGATPGRIPTLAGALAATLSATLLACAFSPSALRAQETDPPAEAAEQEAPVPSVEHLSSPAVADADLPFSEAVRVDGMLYLSGMVGIVPGTTRLVPGGIRPEARQALENIHATVRRFGSSPERIVRCTVMLADIEEWPAFNEVWVDLFDAPYPARSAFAADGLALGARVEVECTAAIGGAAP